MRCDRGTAPGTKSVARLEMGPEGARPRGAQILVRESGWVAGVGICGKGSFSRRKKQIKMGDNRAVLTNKGGRRRKGETGIIKIVLAPKETEKK